MSDFDTTVDYDGKWKTLILRQPVYFIQFFLPEIVPLIDFSVRPKALMQDLAKVLSAPKKEGDIIADLVFEVRLKDGQKRLLYIHIEIQSSWVENFEEKMFIPFYRLRDKYKKDVTAFALFVGATLPKNLGRYHYEFGKTFVNFGYPYYICKNQKEEDLVISDNPFAIAVLACKFVAAQKKKPDFEKLFHQKVKLISDYLHDACRRKGFSEEVLQAMFDFIFNIVLLPRDKELIFREIIRQKFGYMKELTQEELYPPEFTAWVAKEGLAQKLHESFLENEGMAKRLNQALQTLKIFNEEKIAAEKQKAAAEKKKVAAEKEKAVAEKEKVAAEREKIAAEKQKAEIEEKLQKKEMLQRAAILNLYKEIKMMPATIAKVMVVDEKYVLDIIRQEEAKQKKN